MASQGPKGLPWEKDKGILALEARKKVYEAVKSFAGSHFREIERKSGFSTGVAHYHLSYLVNHGLVMEEKRGHKVHYFPSEFKPENKRLLGLLRQGILRKILMCISMQRVCSYEQIVQFVQRPPSTVSWHLKKLLEEKIITHSKKGRNTYFSLVINPQEVIRLLITYRKSFLDSMVDNVIEMWERY
ncbi:transcriptional regulator [Candidatus Woesearchaeota archaeon]|nr:transcriptional regulator [Candidatus Woesearchaeota archaeon]